MLEVSLLGVGTVLRLERDAWSMAKWPGQATNGDPPPQKKKVGADLHLGGDGYLPYYTVFHV